MGMSLGMALAQAQCGLDFFCPGKCSGIAQVPGHGVLPGQNGNRVLLACHVK